jgi:hypothetical protein
MARYRRLHLMEREEISRMLAAGYSLRATAQALRRAPSTVSRELTRHRASALTYRAVPAHQRSQSRQFAHPDQSLMGPRYLVCLVYLVYLVCLVRLVSLVLGMVDSRNGKNRIDRINQTNQINKTNQMNQLAYPSFRLGGRRGHERIVGPRVFGIAASEFFFDFEIGRLPEAGEIFRDLDWPACR